MKSEQTKQIGNTADVRLAILETTVVNINETLIRMERRFDKIDEKLERMDQKIDSKFNVLDGKIDNKFNWLLGIYFTSSLAIFSALIMLFKH